MNLGLLPADSAWAELTDEARALAQQHYLGEYVHPFPVRVGISRKKVDRVYQFRDGLVRQPFGKAPDVFRWTDATTWYESLVHHYWNGRAHYSHTSFQYKLIRADGGTASLAGDYRDGALRTPPGRDGLEQGYAFSAVGRAVCDMLGESALPGVLEGLRRGAPLSFGEYTLSLDCLRFKRHEVPWPMVDRVETKDGWFRVYETGSGRARYERTIATIPRYTLLRGVIDAMLRTTARG